MRVSGFSLALLLTVTTAPDASAQARGRGAAAAPTTRTEAAAVACPQSLGEGVQTKRTYCDVLIGRDPAGGIVITLPPHTGAVTLTFDLHNRHTYSEELVRSGRGFRRYSAGIGVLAMDNTLLERAAIESDFRASTDLVDRIAGGGAPGGVKAVAPTGLVPVTITIPAEEQKVSILGEKLTELRPDGRDEFTVAGRPIAIISNVMVQYRPAPARRPATRRR